MQKKAEQVNNKEEQGKGTKCYTYLKLPLGAKRKAEKRKKIPPY